MRAGNHFKIASLTKTYTATVVLQLVGERKLSLDDTVERRLPGVVPNGDKITIRQLLNHTSGLADFESDPRYLKPYLSGNFGYYWAPRQLVKMGVSQKPLHAPGARSSYSNTNYVVAQLIVERVTGKTIGAELKRRIFQPLQLRQTIYPTKPGLPSPYAHGYKLLGKPPATDVTAAEPVARAGFGRNHLHGRRCRRLLPGAVLRATAQAERAEGDEDDGLLRHRQGRHCRAGSRTRHRAPSNFLWRRLDPRWRAPRLRSGGDLERERAAAGGTDGEPGPEHDAEARRRALRQVVREGVLRRRVDQARQHRDAAPPTRTRGRRPATRVSDA